MKHFKLTSVGVVCLLVTLMILAAACGSPQPQQVATPKPAEAEPTKQPTEAPAPEPTKAPTEEPATEEAAAEEPIEMTVWSWVTEGTNNFQQMGIDDFKKEHPNVNVTFSTFPAVGEGGYEDKILSALATGTGPDVFIILDVQTPRFAGKGQLLPIDETALKAMGFSSMDELLEAYDYKPEALEGWSWDGQPYALLHETSWLALFVNTDCMEDSGLDPETVKLDTWDDVIAAAEAMSRFDDSGNFTREGFDLPTYGDDTWDMVVTQVFLNQTEGSILSPDGTQCWANKPEAVEAFKMMHKLVRDSKAGSPDFGSPGIGGLFSDWFAGENTCMTLWHPPVWGAVIKGTDMENHHRVYPIPTMPDGGEGDVFWGWGYVVNAATEHPDLAWDLVHSITQDFERNCTIAGNWIPLNDLLDSPCVQDNPGRDGLVASLDRNPTFLFQSVYYPEISRIIRNAYELTIFEDKDVQEAMDDACSQIDEILQGG